MNALVLQPLAPIEKNLLSSPLSMLLVFLMYALWSNAFSLGKLTLAHCPPLFLTATRMLLAGVLLLAFLALRNREAFKISKKHFLSLCLLAIFSIYLANAFEFWSLQYLTVAKTCFIYSLSPFFTALFSYFHFKEKMNKRKWLGLAIGMGGMAPVLLEQKGAGELLSTIPFLSWPELAMIAATLFSVYGWVLLRLIVKDSSISPLMANGTSMLIGGAFALFHSFIAEPWNPLPIAPQDWRPFLQGIAAITLISNIICYNFYGMMLKRFTATFLSFAGLFSPIFASLSSWLFLGEALSFSIFLSTGILILGLWLVYSAELKQGYIQRRAEPAPA